jgi:hypothetical protein
MPAFGDKLGPDDIEDSAWHMAYYRIVWIHKSKTESGCVSLSHVF